MKSASDVDYEKYVMSIFIGFTGYIICSLLASVALFAFQTLFYISDEGVRFLSSSAAKFLLAFWIVLTVIKYEKNNLATLGFRKERLGYYIRHTIIVVVIITITFFALFALCSLLNIPSGVGFVTAITLVKLPSFWIFIASSAVAEEILFRAFLLDRLILLAKNKFNFVLIISLIYGLLHYSLWGWSGVIAFSAWGFMLALYYVYVEKNIIPLIIAHLISDAIIFMGISIIF